MYIKFTWKHQFSCLYHYMKKKYCKKSSLNKNYLLRMESNAREKFHEETGRESGELGLSVIPVLLPVYEDSQYVPVLPQLDIFSQDWKYYFSENIQKLGIF